MKQGFSWTVSWNDYRSEMTTKPKNSNLDYMIDWTFSNINWLYILSFKRGGNDPTESSFGKYCIQLVEIKDFNALIDNKPSLDQHVKNKQAYE